MSAPIPLRMRTPDAAAYSGTSVSTLTKLRVFGGGPAYIKAGKTVIYDRADLDAWLNARKRTSTSGPYPIRSMARK